MKHALVQAAEFGQRSGPESQPKPPSNRNQGTSVNNMVNGSGGEKITGDYLQFLEEQIKSLHIEEYGDAVLQQTQQLQSKAVDWWDKTANPYISETYQQLYQIELIKQLDELRAVDFVKNAKKMELMQMDKDRTLPDLSDYFKTF